MHSYVCVFDADYTHMVLAKLAADTSYGSAYQFDCRIHLIHHNVAT